MIHLETENFRLIVDETHGAAVRLFDMRGSDEAWRPILEPLDTSCCDAGASAMFAMLPFANRARDNILVIGDRRIELARNTNDPHALHGTGWRRAWTVERAGRTHCDLSLQPDASEPVRVAAKQCFRLTDDGLRVTLAVENLCETPVPLGLGWHPYFPHMSGTLLKFDARFFWLEGPDHLPTEPVAVPPELSFSSSRPVPATWRNNCYQDWDGRAEILQPELGYRLRLTASAKLCHLMLYAPQTRVFALEPQSHVSGLTTVTDDGLRRMEPGETMAVWLDFMLSALPGE